MALNLNRMLDKLHAMGPTELTETIKAALDESGIPYTHASEPGIEWIPISADIERLCMAISQGKHVVPVTPTDSNDTDS